ncbi:MAG: phenylalanine--tRNA ligase subunit beta [Clostridiales bacterium]|nr:phenylalanine--tRNA ligase subunit beta [Clostridiales bacterium]
MKLSRKWLDEFVEIHAADKEYADKMTMSGSKVEAVHLPGSEIRNVVVGRVLKTAPHPNADKLIVCSVDTGADAPIQIVTAATNVNAGDLVPVALDGARLAGGQEIRSGVLRGEASEGMFCSIAELGLTLHEVPYAVEDGILVLQEECAPGDDIRNVLGLDDHVIEFEITNNRPDCLSVIGLARESAATFGLAMRTHEPVVKGNGPDIRGLLKVEVHDTDLCPRYTARMVTDVRIAPSPRWMRERLSSSGVRPINNIVDITNYVMLEYGQPMHAFDFSCVEGDTIIVRRAGKDSSFVTLDGNERKLTGNMLMIADKNRPVGIAGIMGGMNSEITDNTRNIVFESANFNGTSVRTTATALGIRTDASSRFEKGLDASMTVTAVNRACELVEMLGAGTVCTGIIDIDNSDHTPVVLPLRRERINSLLGISVSYDEMCGILSKLGFTVSGDLVTVPSWRGDVEHMADLAEEVARMYGYDKLPITSFKGETPQGGFTREQKLLRNVGMYARALGYNEILTYSFISPASYDKLRFPEDDERRRSLEILNPLGKDTSIMRTSALPSMMETLQRNYSFRNKSVKFYEQATVYSPAADGLSNETVHLVLGCYGKDIDFYTIKGDVESLLSQMNLPEVSFSADSRNASFHPGRCAVISCLGEIIGTCGQIHPLAASSYDIDVEVYAAELDLALLFRCILPEKHYIPLPKYPAVTRDIALVCDKSITVSTLEDCIRKAGAPLLKEIEFFDIYTGPGIPEGKKSVAFSLVFRSDERNLRDEDVLAPYQAILQAAGDTLNAKLR